MSSQSPHILHRARPHGSRDRIVRILAPFLLAGATLATYFGVWGNGFVYDDAAVIQLNERIHDLGNLGEIFRTEYWNLEGVESRLYRPVTLTSFALQWDRGTGAGAFHLANLLLHFLAVLLLWRFLVPVFASRPEPGRSLAPFLGAAFFAVTPVHSEAVIALVGRSDLLVTLGILGSLLALRRGGRWMGAVPALTALAALSKESGLLLPAWVVAAHLGGFLGNGTRRLPRLARDLLWVGLGLAPALALREMALSGVPDPTVYPDDNVLVGTAGLERLSNAARILFRYASLHFQPDRLSADHGLRALEVEAVTGPAQILPLLVLVGAGLWILARLFVRLRRGESGVEPFWLGLTLYLGTLVASGNFFFLVGTSFGERLSYLPHVGLALVLSSLLASLLSLRSRRVRALEYGLRSGPARSLDVPGLWITLGVFVFSSFVLTESAGVTRRRVAQWRDAGSLFAAATVAQPRSFRAWAMHGNQLYAEGKVDTARVALTRSIELFDQYPQAWVDLVALEYNAGNLEAAAGHARRLRELVPHHVYGYLVAAESALRAGNLPAARAELDRGRVDHPQSRPLLETDGRYGLAAGDWGRAVQAYEEILRLAPGNRAALGGLATASVQSGDWETAARAYEAWHDLDPDWNTANGWAWSLLGRARETSEPRSLLGQADTLSALSLASVPPEYWRYPADTRAQILIELGELSAARELLLSLIQLHPDVPEFRERLRLLGKEP